MQILIIGGTKFLGRHIVRAALERGHTVTTFNRGTATLKEQSAVKKLIGDRNEDLSLLKTQNWDAVIDTCGSDPESVQKSCEYLLDLTDSYTFISTISVYKDYAGPDQSESLTLKNIDTDKREYGSLKAACEAIVEKLYRQNHQILRPGLIVGPDLAGFLAIDSSKAIAAGLKFRPLKSTIKDTYDWDLSRSQAEYLAGLSAEREATLLSQ